MPSTYSKKRKKGGANGKNDLKRTPSNKIKRTGDQAAHWDTALGKSLNIIPQLQLPTIRTVLRRYRYLRTEDLTAPTNKLAGQITKEVMLIWG